MQMPNTEALQEKWAPILDYEGMDPIKDSHRRAVTAVLLENQEQTLAEERAFLSEAPTVSTNSGTNAGFSAGASSPVAG
ncbi:MAG: ATP-binding protein, partial [Candidatus Bathyarchaeota archaeon]|nr:ATP-binding protein [Candidatus Bathyarchaeota archaeon]